uniref:Uncharacterized protein n=1 Tax=Rhizophora mucronata TaxID=61149 RepID=A0A2P2R4W8_RHIMU
MLIKRRAALWARNAGIGPKLV